MKLDNAELFAVFGVAGVAAFFQAASMRGDLAQKWKTRVDLMEAGLTNRATNEALALQDEIGDRIGSAGSSPPQLATADPAPLARRAADLQKTLVMIDRLPTYFIWLLRLGNFAIAICSAFLIALAAVFLDNAEILGSDLLRLGGLFLGALAVGLGLLLFILYAFLNQRLSGAELRGENLR